MFYCHNKSSVKVFKHDAIATLGKTDAKINDSCNMALYVSEWSVPPFCLFAVEARPSTVIARSCGLFPL